MNSADIAQGVPISEKHPDVSSQVDRTDRVHLPSSGRWGQGVPLTHCDLCGLKTARLQVRGELQSLYACQCGHAFERDNIALIPITTQAHYTGADLLTEY
jgi:hypothetical protein